MYTHRPIECTGTRGYWRLEVFDEGHTIINCWERGGGATSAILVEIAMVTVQVPATETGSWVIGRPPSSLTEWKTS